MNTIFDLAIIGGGPAGHDAAIKASKTGLKVIIFEKNKLGGTCLNVGCIPTKHYIYKAKTFKTITSHTKELPEKLDLSDLQKSTKRIINRSIKGLENTLKLLNVTVENKQVQSFSNKELTTTDGNIFCFKNLIIATGTKPFIPGPYKKFENTPKMLTNETIFSMDKMPNSIAIIGAGAIGVEFAFFFSSFGVQTTLIEMAETILPGSDPEIISDARKILKRNKVKVFENTKITDISDYMDLTVETGQEINSDKVLVATGRTPIMPKSSLNLIKTTKGFLETNKNYQTNIDNIFAIGDINGKHLLAHAASHQARQVIEFITNGITPKQTLIPMVIYTNPSFASLTGVRNQKSGIKGSNQQSHASPLTPHTTKIPYGFSGKAQAEEVTDGWIKISTSGNILQEITIHGPNCEDLLPIFSLAIQEQLPIEKLLDIVYPHPTYCEMIRAGIEQHLHNEIS